MFMLGCDDDDNGSGDTVDETALLLAAGDAYFGSYLTTAGESPNISITELYGLLTDTDTTNDPYLLDFRSESDFNAGHINGAVHMSLSELPDAVDTLPTDKTIVTICYMGQTASHAAAFINLIAQDPDYSGLHARNLLFGMSAVGTPSGPYIQNWVNTIATDEWVDQLETTPHTATQTYDLPTINTGENTLAEILKARWTEYLTSNGNWANLTNTADVFVNNSNYFIINYWPQSEYENPGHIPGAYCFPPKTSIQSDADLNKLPLDQDIIVYCYTGQTSAQLAAYLRLLGYKAWSLAWGVNGFAYHALDGIGHQYSPPVDDHSAILWTP